MTKAKAHADRAHSKLGPSAAHRWMACPGSVRMSEDMPNRSTVYALEGTAAHEFVEFVLSTGRDPEDWLGGCIDLKAKDLGSKFIADGGDLDDRERFFAIDDEMVEGVRLVVDLIDELFCREDGDVLHLETRLDMSWIHPKLFGTGDIIIWKPKTGHLIVIDFKYGKGFVAVVDNEQVQTYAVGSAKLYEKPGVKQITTIIVQPRAFEEGEPPVRRAEIDPIDLMIFEGELIEKAAATDDPNAELVVGEQCKFCPAAHACKMLRDHVHESIGVDPAFEDEPSEDHLPLLTKMTTATAGRIFAQVKIIEGWLRRFNQWAHAEALEGRPPEGTKVVEKRAYRKFDAAENEIVGVLECEGLDREDYMKPEKLMSVAQIEKALGKKTFAETLGKYVTKKSTGFVLADADDKRPAAKLDQGDAFGAVEDED